LSSDSFTQRVVAELAPHVPLLACCRAALIEGMALVSDSPATLTTTRMVAARVAMHTLHSDGVAAHVTRVATPRRARYALSRVESGRRSHESDRLCCARSRLRGAFLSAGRLQRAELGPHLEIGCPTVRAAQRIVADAARLGVPAQIRTRRGRCLVCVRRAASVGAFLSGIGAQTGRLDYEAGRVVREVRSTVNRRLNAETANLRRSAAASVTQLAAADELERDGARWVELPPALREAATLRRRHPDDDLASLAAHAGCSRSAMAGRLHRLVALAAGVSVDSEVRAAREETAWR
jgi:WhiA LAGLIDADG-like domain/WhiA C-terminal HTH domain